MTQLVFTVSAGLTVGGIYALLAVSYNVIYSATGVINLAQGAYMMLGASIGWWVTVSLGAPWPLALFVAAAAGTAVALLEERAVWLGERAASSRTTAWILVTFGFAVAMEAVAGMLMGPEIRRVSDFLGFPAVELFDARIIPGRFLPGVGAVVAAIVLTAVYRRTRFGKSLRAIAHDRDAAALRGLPVRQLIIAAWTIGGSLAAVAGVLAVPVTAAQASMGLPFALKGFIAAILGSMPDIRGAFIAGLLLGLLEATVTATLGDGYQNSVVLLGIIAVLFVMPSGLFPSRDTRAV